MTTPPERPKLYHITPVANLRLIVDDGGLVPDRVMVERGGPAQAIGISDIKRRRLEQLEVSCHLGTRVGDYVPFYFCPRSVMLYVIYRANHPNLTYVGGQEPILHLEADFYEVVRWAEAQGVRWAFSLSNAGAFYAEFRRRLDDLDDLNWQAIAATDFRPSEVKEAKQAEFLVHEWFPFTLVERIGVHSTGVMNQVREALAGVEHQPAVEIRSDWYF